MADLETNLQNILLITGYLVFMILSCCNFSAWAEFLHRAVYAFGMDMG